MPDVVFTTDAENAKALAEFGRIAKSLQNLERKHAKAADGARRQDKALDGMGRTVARLGKGLLALGGIGSAVGALGQVSQRIDEVSRSSANLNRDIRPLLSLGDNFKDIEGIRKNVLSGSTGLGRGSKEVTDAFFALQSGASNLDDTVRNDLFRSASQLAFLQNGDLAGSVNLLVKFYQNYGDQVKSVTELSDKLFATADRGALTLDELASFGPDVAAAAKIMNISMEELLGTLIVTTQQLGRNERTFTGVRNVILRMSNAQREGINLTGSFTDKLQQLSRVKPDVLKKVFGDEAISAIAVASKNSGAIADEVGRLNREAGALSTKIKNIVKDQQQLSAINLAAADEAKKNVLAGDLSPGVSAFALRKADIETGILSTGLGQFQPETLTKFQAGLGAALLGGSDFVNDKLGGDRGEGFLSRSFRSIEDVGREVRSDAQQRSFPEVFRQNLHNEGVIDLDKMSKAADRLNQAAEKQLQAAQAQERAAGRRSINAQRE